MAYLRIEDHGIIGDMHTVALVGIDGTIDWYCFPHFDSPSVFGSLLDDKKGGYFRIAPADQGFVSKQLYLPETNILVTRYLSPQGVAELTDFMPIGGPEGSDGFHDLVRNVRVVRGTVKLRMECIPAFNYARDSHQTEILSNGAIFRSPRLSLSLASGVPVTGFQNGVAAEFTLNELQSVTFYLRDAKQQQQPKQLTEDEFKDLLYRTRDYWQRWAATCTYNGRWREMITRSALILKLMTFKPTGAIIAAPTTSLPEWIGGHRNWDYRFNWIRDAAFTLYALLRLGFKDSAAQFMNWIQSRCQELDPQGSLQTLYRIDGGHETPEEILDHLEGYKGSSPVRIGNAAYQQLQLDVYGELMDSVYLYNKYVVPISFDLWKDLRRLVNWVCDNWNQPDAGIWEVRGGPQNFTYSKLMCWVAIDRGLRLADKRSFPAEREKWYRTRDQIYEQVMQYGWNREKQTFVQYFGSNLLDASLLIMPLVFFVSPEDPRMLKTLEAIQKPVSRGGLLSDTLVYRYNWSETEDGLNIEEGSFNMCTFWLVEALTRAGYEAEARLIFEKMLGYANHLGLFAEQTGPTGEALGNFPQALTHLALISSGYNLNRRLNENRSIVMPE
jgi:GH15 family glucan-1,4-alpha-glucosidase